MINRSGIYKITCTANGRFYIGSAVWFRDRWNTHRSAARRGKHHSRYLQNAWNKYSEGAFKFEVILLCAREDLIMYEQRAIDVLKPRFNTHPAAGTPLGYKHTPEARQNMSAAQKLVNREGREWRRPTESEKKKLSESHKGVLNPMYGRVMTPDERQKHSEARKGFKHSEKSKANYSKAARLRYTDPAQRLAISVRMKGRKVSPEASLMAAKKNGIGVTIGGTSYHSTKAAARAVGRHEATLMTWVDKGVVPAGNGTFSGLYVARENRSRPECRHMPTSSKAYQPLKIGDVEFASRKKAAKAFGVTVTTVSRWVEVGSVLKPRTSKSYDTHVGCTVENIK